MGLGSSSYKYFAYSGTSSLFEEDTREDTIKSLIYLGIIGGGRTIADSIQMGAMTNMYARARALIRYANKKYYYGLPETDQNTFYVELNDVILAIESITGEPIIAHSLNWGVPIESFFLNKSVHDSYLDPDYFPWPAGNPVDSTWHPDSETTAIPVQNPDTLQYYQAQNPPDFIRVNAQESYDSLVYKVSFRYTDNLGNPQVWDVPTYYDLAYTRNKTWVMCEYYLASNTEDQLYWAYEIDSEDIPWFENELDKSSLVLNYLPVGILMQDKVWFDERSEFELEETTKKLFKRLALDPYDMKEEFLAQKEADDASGDGNKSNAETWDFFIHFAVPIHSRIRGSREYIWHFLKFLEAHGQWTSFDNYQNFLTAWNSGQRPKQPSSFLHVKEGGETGFHSLYGWSYIHSAVHEGLYNPPGPVPPLGPKDCYSKLYQHGSPDYSEGIYEVHGPGTPIFVGTVPEGYSHDYVVFTRQNSTEDGIDSYTQILMMAPAMFYVVNTSEDGNYRIRYVDVELFPEDPEQDSEFRFPVHIGSMREVAFMHREEMLQDALAATVYLVDKVKVKWYQKGFFKWLIIVIVIIIVIYAPQLLSYLWQMAASAWATGAVVVAALWFAAYVAVSFAIGWLVSFAGSLIGGTWGTVFVIVATLYMMWATAGKPSIKEFGKSLIGLGGQATTGWGTAFKMINTVSPVVQYGMNYYITNELDKMQEDLRTLLKTVREKTEELEEIWESLGKNDSGIDPMDVAREIVGSEYVEFPDAYYARSLNTNPGILGYQLVYNFAQFAILLPRQGESNIVEGVFRDLAEQRRAI